MAWLERKPGGNFLVVFRFQGARFARSLKTHSEVEARGRLARLEETIRLVEARRIVIPAGCGDVAAFLLTDGQILTPQQKPNRLTLGEVFDELGWVSSGVVVGRPVATPIVFRHRFKSLVDIGLARRRSRLQAANSEVQSGYAKLEMRGEPKGQHSGDRWRSALKICRFTASHWLGNRRTMPAQWVSGQ